MTDPYYEDDLVTLYHGDCREVTAWLEADVLVTDPPYGRAWRQGRIEGKGPGRTRGDRSDPNPGIANDLTTDIRDSAIEAWGKRPAVLFGDLMLPPPEGVKLVGVYRKPADAGMRGAVGGVRRDAEALYWLGPWPSGLGGRSSIFTTSAPTVGGPYGIAARSGGHPHAKPLDVLEELIDLCPRGVVADPFAGSASTLMAAKLLGRRAIGVELDERYCELSASRLAQDTLFGGAA
jgi:hypothetical protein